MNGITYSIELFPTLTSMALSGNNLLQIGHSVESYQNNECIK